MDDLINRIEDVVIKLFQYDQNAYAIAAEDLVNQMIAGLPTIVLYYTDPRMTEHAGDATYWPAQIERIIKALGEGDDIATADVLYNETRANLIELRDILTEKGMI